MNHEKPPKSTPGDGSRSTWGAPKTALPPPLGETPAYPPLAPQIREDFIFLFPPELGGHGVPSGDGGSGGAKILFVQEV